MVDICDADAPSVLAVIVIEVGVVPAATFTVDVKFPAASVIVGLGLKLTAGDELVKVTVASLPGILPLHSHTRWSWRSAFKGIE